MLPPPEDLPITSSLLSANARTNNNYTGGTHPSLNSMPPQPLCEALRRLCCDHGWSYGALWRPNQGDPRFLMMDECYCEEQFRTMKEEMRNQVHILGQGTLGVAAISGKHQWIHSDTCINLSQTCAGDNLDILQGNANWLYQFIAGIQTIAIISFPSFGVFQFGSAQKISESPKFADQVRYMLWQLETITGLFQTVDAQKAMSYGNAFSSNINISTFNENVYQNQLARAESSTDLTQPSGLFSRGTHDGPRYHDGSMNLSTEKTLPKESSFELDIPDFPFSFPQDFELEHSQLIHPQDDLLSISCESSALVGHGSDLNTKSSNEPNLLLSDHDLFDGMELVLSPSWDDIVLPSSYDSCSNLTTSTPDCIDIGSAEDADTGFFPKPTLELWDAAVANASSVVGLDSELSYRNQAPLFCHPSLVQTPDMPLPECSSGQILSPHVSSWGTENSVINQPRKPEETRKTAKKRDKPRDTSRPRPKDRQQIQDRVKELREIVPNSAKCSIDSLLDRAIKHMLFLQSVTKYADRLKVADEPKMIGEESVVVLKDNLTCGGSDGTTWAYEVAGQTMLCPILVEDINPPGPMLIEMICEDRGLFLEIADIICGFGLTILKGVMETCVDKIWARFLVEVNQDVTRMDIFLSLVQLVQQASCSPIDQLTKFNDKRVPRFSNYQQTLAPILINHAVRL